jgi:hypothetical protein
VDGKRIARKGALIDSKVKGFSFLKQEEEYERCLFIDELPRLLA